MAYSLSFSEEFFTGKQNIGYNLDFSIKRNQKPNSVIDALIHEAKFFKGSFKQTLRDYYPDLYKYMVKFKIDPIDDNMLYELLDHIREINTCDNLTVPVKVWLSPDGWITVDVYD
jgi:hypothetical protein